MTQLAAPPTSRPAPSDEVDLKQVFAVLRRRALPLLLAPLLVGGGTYLLFRQQPPTYESVTSVMSAQPDSVGAVLTGASVAAPQLPQGAVAEVLRSRSVVQQVAGLIAASDLPAADKNEIRRDLLAELRSNEFRRIAVKARVDVQQRGVYELQAQAGTPAAAQALADAAAAALLDWDLARARQGVTRARQNIQQQLSNLTERLNALPEGSIERQSLIAARGELLLNLSQATVLEGGAVGSLTLLSEANEPDRPVSPKPLRNAVLAALLTLFIGTGLALLLDALQRRVRGTADLLGLGLATLGEMPKMKGIQRRRIIEAATRGSLYEPSGFVRVNLASALPTTGAVVAVTSARPGEGKSTVTATLAASFALAGKRVLVIDLDLHRPMQHEFWSLAGLPWVALAGASQPQQTTVGQAIEHPETASAVDVGDGVHLLPAGAVGRRVVGLVSRPEFPALLRRWASGYDVVIIDTPPVLALADAFMVARHTDGLVLVVASGETSMPEVQRVVQNAASAQTRLLGVVVNKVSRSEQSYYSYGYTRDQVG